MFQPLEPSAIQANLRRRANIHAHRCDDRLAALVQLSNNGNSLEDEF